MPISDPGNAGTAGSRDDWPEPRLADRKPSTPQLDADDTRRRVMALCMAVITALVLLPAVVTVTLTGEWRWLAGGLGAWLTLSIIVSSVTTYRYGAHRRNP